MIFERRYDQDYHRWFAWRPVRLYGPDEWNRQRRLQAKPRLVWLRSVWRWRCQPQTYYALFEFEAEAPVKLAPSSKPKWDSCAP